MDYPKSIPSVGLVNGKFVDENPVAGTPGSLIPSAWGNSVTDELLSVISAAGMTPEEGKNDQLLKALRGTGVLTTAAQFDSSKRGATTEFVRQAAGSRSGYVDYQGVSGVIPARDAGKYIGFNRGAAQAYVLPDANTLPLGTSFYLESVGGDITLTAPNSMFAGPAAQGAASSYVLKRDTACEFIVISNVTAGDASLSYRVLGGVGKALVARNGYERMPNGLIRMWGDGYGGGHASHAAVGPAIVKNFYNAFPMPFPNELFGVVATHGRAGSVGISIVTASETVNGFNAAASYAVDCVIRWQAIGR